MTGNASQPARLLIVEDDRNLRDALADNLQEEGYLVEPVGTGAAARRALADGNFDLVILDIMLPDVDGYAFCREMRKRSHRPHVLMLTARTLENDLVEGFDSGADDYVTKPYRLRELLARISALLRRTRHTAGEDVAPVSANALNFGEFTIDAQARTVCRSDGSQVHLTRTEFDLLVCLLTHAGRALTRQQLLAEAWDPDVLVEPRTVDNFVSSLRKKLDWTEDAPYRITTVRGVGYRMELN